MRVLKFGGTSMGSPESIKDNVAPIIKSKAKNEPIIVVVSAMSGVTNQLLAAANHAVGGNLEAAKKELEAIRKSHHEAIRKLVKTEKWSLAAQVYIDEKIDGLAHFTKAIGNLGELNPTNYDIIVGSGEKLSAKLLSCYLNDLGLKSSYENLAKVIPPELKYDTNAYWDTVESIFATHFANKITENNIPVATGYFGPNPGGILEAVGRGYSDFCAALCGSAMQADEIEIWTDVDGIMSANPRIVECAQVLDQITFTEAGELSHFGAKVLHPQSIRPALHADIPLRILNTFNHKARGTVISSESIKGDYPFKSITYKENITVLRICSLRMLLAHGFLARLFELFAKHEISVDLVATAEASVSVTVEKPVEELQDLINDLKEIGSIHVLKNMAIVSIVGQEMAGENYIQGKIYDVLSENKIKMHMTSVDASLVNISLVVDGDEVKNSVKLLHQVFLKNCKNG